MPKVKIAAGIAGVLLLLAFATPFLFNADRYRASVTESISQQTGREVTLGRIRATIVPRVGFSVDGFHMGNPKGFPMGDFITAAEVRGSVAIWPMLLRREVKIKSVELFQPKLFLLEDSRGKRNYDFTSAARESAAQGAAGTQGGAAPEDKTAVSVLHLNEVTLLEGEIVYGQIDNAGAVKRAIDASGFSLGLRNVSLQPMRLRDWQADAKLSGARFSLAEWNAPVTFASGAATLRNGALKSDFSMSFGKAARVDGTFAVADVDHAVAKFDLKTDDIDLDELAAGLTSSVPSTVAAGKPKSPVPSARAESPAARTAKAAPTAPPVAAVETAPAVQGGTKPATTGGGELVAEGHLAAARIRSGPHLAGPATADLRLYSDRMEIWPITVRVYDGAVQAAARTDRRQVPERFSINIEARNLNIGEMIVTSPSIRGKLAGTGELDAHVFGSLDQTLQQSLTGEGQLTIRNGRISGFSLPSAATAVVTAANVSGETTFTAISGDFAISNERVTSKNVRLDSPQGTASVAGSFGFDGSLNYDGEISPVMPAKLPATEAAGPAPPPNAEPANTTTPANAALNSVSNPALQKMIGADGKLTVSFGLRGTVQNPQLVPGAAVKKGSPAAKKAVAGAKKPVKPAFSFPNASPK